MSTLNSTLGFSRPSLPSANLDRSELLVVHRPLRRVLNFLGFSIDDLCNNPIVKNQVIGYFKLYKTINRTMEVSDLERQWNPASLRF